MLALTQADACILRAIAHELSHSQEEEQNTFDTLYQGFSQYGDPKFVAKHRTLEAYFRESAQRLYQNIDHAGKTSKEACSSKEVLDLFEQILRSLGVPRTDEDAGQEVIVRALRLGWFENYNPTRSGLRHYLESMIRNLLHDLRGNESRNPSSGAVHLDGLGEEGQGGGVSFLYATDDSEGSLDEQLDTKGVITWWEDFLEAEKPFRVRYYQGFKYLCTLLPPGTKELPVAQETTVFLFEKGIYNCRVTTWELYDLGILPKVSCDLLVDWISKDPVTGKELANPEKEGDWICQKYCLNPEYDHSLHQSIDLVIPVRELYLFLRDGWQMDEIARWYRMPPTSLHAWVKRLDQCFLTFLLTDRRVPEKGKWWAASTYKCPGCKKLSLNWRMTCTHCGCDMSKEMGKVRFKAYPWPRPYVTRATQERLGNRKAPMEVMRGSISCRDSR